MNNDLQKEINHLNYLKENHILTKYGRKKLKKLEKQKRLFKKSFLNEIPISFLFNFVNEFTENNITLKEIKRKLKEYEE